LPSAGGGDAIRDAAAAARLSLIRPVQALFGSTPHQFRIATALYPGRLS